MEPIVKKEETAISRLTEIRKKQEIGRSPSNQTNSISEIRSRFLSVLEEKGTKKAKALEVSAYNHIVREYKKSGVQDVNKFISMYSLYVYSLLSDDSDEIGILKDKEQYIDSVTYDNYDVEEGIYQCKCGSKKTRSYSLQLRRSDEPSTTFISCLICGNKWKQSG